MTTNPHQTAPSQDMIDRAAAALEVADIGHSMSLTRLVDGVHTYTLSIRGKIEEFIDNDDANAIDQVYARIREVKHRLQAEAVIAALHAPITEAGNGGDGEPRLEKLPVAFEVLDTENGVYLTRSEQAAINTGFEYSGLYRRSAVPSPSISSNEGRDKP